MWMTSFTKIQSQTKHTDICFTRLTLGKSKIIGFEADTVWTND